MTRDVRNGVEVLSLPSTAVKLRVTFYLDIESHSPTWFGWILDFLRIR